MNEDQIESLEEELCQTALLTIDLLGKDMADLLMRGMSARDVVEHFANVTGNANLLRAIHERDLSQPGNRE